jgi:metallo-beta-lactamase family protein
LLFLATAIGCGGESQSGSRLASSPTQAKVTVYGAAGQVSGSLSLLDTGTVRCLIDCGAFYANAEEAVPSAGDAAFAFRPQDINAVFVTHSHQDHIGRLPSLVSQGYRGPIYLTEASRELAAVMLESAVKYDESQKRSWCWSQRSLADAKAQHHALTVHWRSDCTYAQKISPSNRQSVECTLRELNGSLEKRGAGNITACRTCLANELGDILKLFRVTPYNSPIPIGPGLQAEFLDAGHIPGSASVLFSVVVGGKEKRFLFSGDLGSDLSALIPGPRPAPNVDAVFVETTYGPKPRSQSVSGERKVFRSAVADAVRNGGIAWIPAFALDRTQKILYELHLAQQEKTLPSNVPIFCPSPTARKISDIYRLHQKDGWFRTAVADDRLAWSPDSLAKSAKLPGRLPRPCVLITTSGMMMYSLSKEMAGKLLPDGSVTVFLVGYQDPDTPGSWLKEGRSTITIGNQTLTVRAKIRSFGCFSAHGDSQDIDIWLAKIRRDARVVLVHGDKSCLTGRREQLTGQGWKNVLVAEPGVKIDLLPATE